MNKQTLLEQLKDIECQLSPENLTCDGEADPAWVRRESVRLNKAKQTLISQLGYEPTYNEIWGY